MIATAAQDERLDGVFRALAHPVRRRLLDLLRAGPVTTGDLADHISGMTRYGVMKHLGVLVDAGLVVVTRRGRERWNHLNPVPITALQRRWVSRFSERAADRLLTLRAHLEREDAMPDPEVRPFRVDEVVAETPVAASAARAWRAITEEIGSWWPKGFLSSPKAERMVLEPFVGGRVYEDWGDGPDSGLLWYHVIGIDPGHELRLAGELTPDWGGPARLTTRWTVTAADGGGCVVRMEETLWGRATEGTPAKMTEGMHIILNDHFKPYAEGQRPSEN